MSNYTQTPYPQGTPANYAPQGAAAEPDKKLPIIAIVGSVIALIGSCLNWTMAEGETGGIKGTDGDGMISLITAILAAVLFVGGMLAKKGVLHVAGAVAALVTLVIGAINIADPERLFLQKAEDEGMSESQAKAAADQLGLDFTAGAGSYMVAIGALAALVCGFLAFKNSRSSN
ncbi:hypothetical protein [Streptomyces palmae]|uniref:Uncharacterized protein n=1 Tax=Streptomyces palmae TaxID=1701085 RepID=A0A4Z0GU68_9ACTN|nr:hypothetical protein [Streptomyces palmae]TGB00559.1 hypothetical protein E4099_21840 [Streptomyces palmae]